MKCNERIKTDVNLKTNLGKFGRVKEKPAIENERGFIHGVVNGLPVDVSKLFPLCCNDNGFGILTRFERR